MSVNGFIPYCGLPPVPGEASWTVAPVLIGVLFLIGAAYATRSHAAVHGRQRLMFTAGLALTLLAFISPLCNLGVALFSARVTQHMVLTLVAAPLLVLGRIDVLFPPLGRASSWKAINIGTCLFAALMWLWHLPGPYDLTLQNNTVYWLMHTSLFVAALILWYGLLIGGRDFPGLAMVAAFATTMQMSFLSAILVLAGEPLFAVHETTTWPWGLSPLEDQQLGGLIMWVPSGLLFTACAVAAFAAWLNSFSAEDGNLQNVGG